jgi:putative flippase GtrA
MIGDLALGIPVRLEISETRKNRKKLLHYCAIGLCTGLLGAVIVSLLVNTPASASKTQAQVTAAAVSLPVTVTNTNAHPVFTEDVDNAARQHFAIIMCNSNYSGTICGNLPHFYTVPTGERLVIEQVSGSCISSDPAGSVEVNVTATVGGAGVLTVLPEGPSIGALGYGFVIPATQTRIYPDAGTDLDFGFSPSAGTGNGVGFVCNGYLIGYTERP